MAVSRTEDTQETVTGPAPSLPSPTCSPRGRLPFHLCLRPRHGFPSRRFLRAPACQVQSPPGALLREGGRAAICLTRGPECGSDAPRSRETA